VAINDAYMWSGPSDTLSGSPVIGPLSFVCIYHDISIRTCGSLFSREKVHSVFRLVLVLA
jgi:hypothetical protein